MSARDEEHLYSLPYDRMPQYNNYEDLLNLPKINDVTLIGNLSLNDLGIVIPTKVSDLTNDLHFATESQVPTHTSQLVNNSGFTTQNYVDNKISQTVAQIPTKTSDLTNDSHFATESQLPTKTSELTNDSDFTTKTYVDTELAKYDVIDGATVITNILGTETFTSTFDNLATNLSTKLAALKGTLQSDESVEILALKINTIGNVKPTSTVIIDSTTDLLSLVIDWQGVTYNNNVVQMIDIVNKKVLQMTMTNDTPANDAFVSYFGDITKYTFVIEYRKYKTIDLT
jgi:hypothetical protein